jgi:hypothetical protein
VVADDKILGDRAVALAGSDQPKHLELADRQPMGIRRPLDQRVDVRELRYSPQLREDLPRSLELQITRIVIVHRSASEPEEHASPRCLVGHGQLLPRMAGTAERDECAGAVPGGEGNGTTRISGRGRQRVAPLPLAICSSSRQALSASSTAPAASMIST